jgi:Flp pilus assembly protein protease CpaA
VTAIAGGVVSIIMAILTHRRNRGTVEEIGEEEEKVSLAKVPIPYGVAIATGGLAMLGMMVQPILLPG